MSKKCSSWPSNQPLSSMNTDLSMIKLIAVKGDQKDQFKNLEIVEANSPMYNDVDVSSPSTKINTRVIRPIVIVKQSASYSATPTDIPSLSINEQNKELVVEKPLKDTSSTPKRNHKHKHHHHHHCRRHHHNRRHQVKNTDQQPMIVYRKVSNNQSYTVDTNAFTNTNNETILIDDQQAPLVINKQEQEIKTTKGNIPLQSIENKLVSQRVAPKDETQVSNYPPIICSQSTPSIINNCDVQQIQQIIYEDDCCLPSSTINCASNSCIFQQSDPFVCCPQQQQQQLFYCTDPISPQDYICSPTSTIINQIPFCNSLCAPQTAVQPTASIIIQQQPQIQAQPIQYIQISPATQQVIQTIQVPTQTIAASPQILYQRPYDPFVIPVQNQPLAVAQTPVVALSQPSYAPARIVSVAPARQQLPGPRMFQHALVRSIANQSGLPVLVPSASVHQLAQSSMVNPSGGAPLASTARPLFTDGRRPSASIPIVPLTPGGLLIPFQPYEPPKGMIRGELPRTSGYPSRLRNFDHIRQQIQQRAQLLADLQRENSNRMSSLPMRSANAAAPQLPIFSPNVPRSPSGLFPSVPRSPPGFLPSVPRSPSGLFPSVPRSPPGFLPSAPRSPPGFFPNAPRSPPGFFPSVPRPPPVFSSSIPVPPPGLSPSIPQPSPAVIRPQAPYTSQKITDISSSSSSSSRSSASSTSPAAIARSNPSNLTYSKPSFGDSVGGPILSGPSAPYQSIRP